MIATGATSSHILYEKSHAKTEENETVLSAEHFLALILAVFVAVSLGVHIGLLTWVCMTIFPSHLTPSYCGNKAQIQGGRNMQYVPGTPPIWMVKSQITGCGGPLL